MYSSLKIGGLWLAVMALVSLAGCGEEGPPVGTVTGQVTMDGQPLPNALVTFMPEGGSGVAVGQTDANGKYSLVYGTRKGAPLGMHSVTVTTVQQASGTGSGEELDAESDAYEKASMGAAMGSAKAASTAEKIPAKYNTQTTLKHEVKSGSNTINLELTSS